MTTPPAQPNPTPTQFDAGDLVGVVLAERFQLQVKIAQTKRGAVYRARHVGQERAVAVEVLNVIIADESARTRFRLKAASTTTLSHGNIVTTIDYGVTEEGVAYIVTELLEGESLSKIIKRLGRLPLEVFFPLFKQACSGLAFAWRKGAVHWDLQPECIWLIDDGTAEVHVKIADFGIAQLINRDGQLSKTGEVRAGSAFYISPEQAQGQALDARSNVYSLACVMYEALCGQPPFKADNAGAVICLHMEAAPPPVVPEVLADPRGQALARVIERALSKEAEQRQQTAEELKSDLEKAEAGNYSAPVPPDRTPQGVQTTQTLRARETEIHEKNWRNIGIISGAAGLLILVGLAGALSLFQPKAEPQKRPQPQSQARPETPGAEPDASATTGSSPGKPHDQEAANQFDLARYQALKSLTGAFQMDSGHERDVAIAAAAESANKASDLAITAWGTSSHAAELLRPLCEQVVNSAPSSMGDLNALFDNYYRCCKASASNTVDAGVAECWLARSLHYRHEMPQALEHYKSGISTLERAKAEPAVAYKQMDAFGSYYADQLDWKNAVEWFEKAVKIGDVSSIKLTHDYGLALIDLAGAYRHLRRFDDASAVLTRAEPLVRSDAAAAQLWFDIKQEVEQRDAN